MFADVFWPNFAIFVLGQTVACLYLGTGRVFRGGCLMLSLLLLADIALVARFGYGAEPIAVAALSLLQVYACVEAGLFVFGRWHRQRPHVRARRRDEYRLALIAELQADDDGAATLLRGLCRRDPWDVESTLGLARAQRRRGDLRAAHVLLQRARRLDRAGRFGDLIFLESGRVQSERAAVRLANTQRRQRERALAVARS
jgi:hypothetical protein